MLNGQETNKLTVMKRETVLKGGTIIQLIAKVHDAILKAQKIRISYEANGTTHSLYAENICNDKRFTDRVNAIIKSAKEHAEFVLEKELNKFLKELEAELEELKD